MNKRLSLYQLIVEAEVERKLLNLSLEVNKNYEYFNEVYNAYSFRLYNLKRITIDADEHLSKLMLLAYQGTEKFYRQRD